MNILFLCTSNLHRSATAADHFSKLNDQHGFKGAGLDSRNCKQNGTTFCTDEMMVWADLIYVMESMHTVKVMAYSCSSNKKIINLNIPDIYIFNDPVLIEVLQTHNELSQFLI